MAVEARRACGFRKVGGLYLVGEGSGMECCRMPIELTVCPTCHGGIKQTRGWTWIDPRPFLTGKCQDARQFVCPLASDAMGDRVGLLWIGEKFYTSPRAFQSEADQMGISRRITAVPRGFKVGEHWVWLAHPKLFQRAIRQPEEDLARGLSVVKLETEWVKGVFRVFKPTAIEKIVTQTQAEDLEAMINLRKAGIIPVIVPDDDTDHQGSVYDDDLEPELPLPDHIIHGSV